MEKRYSKIINTLLRFYLRHIPITEGKKKLVSLLSRFSMPNKSIIYSKMKDNYFLKLNLNNPEHKHMYLYSEHDERYERRALLNLIRIDDVVWDIGANIGFYSLLFSKLATKGKVIAFEPSSISRSFLEKSIDKNNICNIDVKDFALGSKKESTKIFFSNDSNAEGTASMIYDPGKEMFEEINVFKIDELQDLDIPNFIKIDVEGTHNEVLKGGQKFFKNFSPLIMIELKDIPERDKYKKIESMKIFKDLNYDIFEIKKNGLKFCFDILKSECRNFIVCKKNNDSYSRISSYLL